MITQPSGETRLSMVRSEVVTQAPDDRRGALLPSRRGGGGAASHLVRG